MRQAKKHGAEAVDPEDREKSDAKPKYFTGGGYRLGDTEGQSEFVAQAGAPQDARPVRAISPIRRSYQARFACVANVHTSLGNGVVYCAGFGEPRSSELVK